MNDQDEFAHDPHNPISRKGLIYYCESTVCAHKWYDASANGIFYTNGRPLGYSSRKCPECRESATPARLEEQVAHALASSPKEADEL